MILYFSGTGNCKYVAEQIAAAVGDTAVSVEDSGGKIALEMGEIFGIVFPTHFWEIPAIMREFLEKASITAERENYAFAIATYGTTPGCSGMDAKKLLKKKGIDLSAAFSLKMPDNWTPMFDLSDAEKVRRQNEEADKNLAVLIENIKAREKGNRATPKAPYFARIISDKLYLKARRTSNFYVEDTCVGCGLCAKQCPVHAIEIQNEKLPLEAFCQYSAFTHALYRAFFRIIHKYIDRHPVSVDHYDSRNYEEKHADKYDNRFQQRQNQNFPEDRESVEEVCHFSMSSEDSVDTEQYKSSPKDA